MEGKPWNVSHLSSLIGSQLWATMKQWQRGKKWENKRDKNETEKKKRETPSQDVTAFEEIPLNGIIFSYEDQGYLLKKMQ